MKINRCVSFYLKISALIIFILGFAASDLKSQNFHDYLFNQNFNSCISIDGYGGYDSDIIKKELARSFFKGEFLSQEIRKNSKVEDDKIKKIGAELSAGLSLSFPAKKIFKKDSLNVVLSFATDNAFAIDFNNNYYDMFFFGNEQFRGETIALNNFRYVNWLTRSVGIGVLHRKSNAFLSLNVYQGLSHDNYQFDDGTLTTAEDGRSLIVDVDGAIFDSNYNQNNRKTTNGIGFGISGRINVLDKRRNSKLFVSIKDAGVMIRPAGSKMVALDSTYNFEGVLFNDLFSPGSNDTISVLNSIFSITKKDAEKVVLLPTKIGFNYLKTLNDVTTLQLIGQSNYINLWRPELQLGILRSFKDSWMLGAQLKYGGYGNSNINVLASFSPIPNLLIDTKFSYLSGWLLASGYGAHLGVGIKYYFNLTPNVE